jgi:hypothetical protein
MGTEKIYGEELAFDGSDLEITGDVNIDGYNLFLTSTLGAERVIDGTFDVVGLGDWVLSAGWSDGTGKAAKAADGTGTLTQAVAIAAVVGTTYKITYQVLDVTVDGVTLTYGGVSDVTKLADGTYTFYVTAITTGSLILTPSSNGSRFSIDNVSVKALTDATGDLTVDGNLEVRSPVTLRSGLTLSNGQILLTNGSSTLPSLGFENNPTKGIFSASFGQIVFTSGISGTPTLGIKASDSSVIFGLGIEGGGANFGLGIYSGTTLCATFEDCGLILGSTFVNQSGITNGLLVEGSVGIGKLIPTRKVSIMTDLDIYELFTDVNNYERYAFIASGNQLEIKAETLGTGSDDLDIALTPAGTGNVKFGTVVGTGDVAVNGYLTIKDAAGNTVKLATVA